MTDQNAPATKQDITLLMEQIGKLYDANEGWKDEVIAEVDGRISASEERMEARMTAAEERMISHFDLVAENTRHDFLNGAIPDRIAQHEDRIRRLERQAGIAASA